jgi:hypothetical protein
MLKTEVRVHPLEPRVLAFQFAQSRHVRGPHAAELRPPLVERGRTDPCLRVTSATATPPAASFSIAAICASLNFDFRMTLPPLGEVSLFSWRH